MGQILQAKTLIDSPNVRKDSQTWSIRESDYMLTYLGWLGVINTLVNPACGESGRK